MENKFVTPFIHLRDHFIQKIFITQKYTIKKDFIIVDSNLRFDSNFKIADSPPSSVSIHNHSDVPSMVHQGATLSTTFNLDAVAVGSV